MSHSKKTSESLVSSSPSQPEEYLTPSDVCELLHVSVSTLSRMRFRKGGIPFVRMSSRKVLYKRSDIDAWIRDHLTRPGDALK